METEISLVFPAYNEANDLEKAVSATLEELSKMTPAFEIIIAEDGSSDGTDEIADEIAAKHDEVRHMHSIARLGRVELSTAPSRRLEARSSSTWTSTSPPT